MTNQLITYRLPFDYSLISLMWHSHWLVISGNKWCLHLQKYDTYVIMYTWVEKKVAYSKMWFNGPWRLNFWIALSSDPFVNDIIYPLVKGQSSCQTRYFWSVTLYVKRFYVLKGSVIKQIDRLWGWFCWPGLAF